MRYHDVLRILQDIESRARIPESSRRNRLNPDGWPQLNNEQQPYGTSRKLSGFLTYQIRDAHALASGVSPRIAEWSPMLNKAFQVMDFDEFPQHRVLFSIRRAQSECAPVSQLVQGPMGNNVNATHVRHSISQISVTSMSSSWLKIRIRVMRNSSIERGHKALSARRPQIPGDDSSEIWFR